ncbi:MAG TPA: hypothetical protein VGQ23_16785 [Burkholderiaceae bacterium]|jgi:hypothetical protein|nr:hypothetical protein [Burkholderiaceae bacterium]
MSSLARSVYLDSEFGVEQELPRAGSTLENPYVFDATARELKEMADRGLVVILSEHIQSCAQDLLIDRLRFKRLR